VWSNTRAMPPVADFETSAAGAVPLNMWLVGPHCARLWLRTLQTSKYLIDEQSAAAKRLHAKTTQNEASHDFGLTETTAKSPLQVVLRRCDCHRKTLTTQ